MSGALEFVRVVTYNVRFGMGRDGRIDLERIAQTVCGADVIALQEVERFWQRSGMCDQPALLAGHLCEYHWVYFPAFDVDAAEAASDGKIRNRRRHFGPMTLSRFPILSARRLALPKLADGNTFNMDTGVLECVIETDAAPLRVCNVHLGVSERDQRIQIPWLLEFRREAQAGGGAWSGRGDQLDVGHKWDNDEASPPQPAEALVLGDFNCEPGSEGYRLMVEEDGFIDSWTVARERGEARVTWIPPSPAHLPGREMTIDYCFVSRELENRTLRAWVDDAAQGSDHRPYWVELAPPGRSLGHRARA